MNSGYIGSASVSRAARSATGKWPHSVAEVLETRLERQRQRIVDTPSDAVPREVLSQGVALPKTDDILMIDVIGRGRREVQPAMVDVSFPAP